MATGYHAVETGYLAVVTWQLTMLVAAYHAVVTGHVGRF